VLPLPLLQTAVSFGAMAACIPGPLLALISSEAIRHGRRNAVCLSFVPLITDAPLITLSVLAYSQVSKSLIALQVVSFLGGLLLLWIAWGCFKVRKEDFYAKQFADDDNAIPGPPWKKAILMNLLNPNPYLFWFSICAKQLYSAFQLSLGTGLLFIALFYSVMLSGHLFVALSVSKAGEKLDLTWLVWTNRFLGLALLYFAFSYLWQGLGH